MFMLGVNRVSANFSAIQDSFSFSGAREVAVWGGFHFMIWNWSIDISSILKYWRDWTFSASVVKDVNIYLPGSASYLIWHYTFWSNHFSFSMDPKHAGFCNDPPKPYPSHPSPSTLPRPTPFNPRQLPMNTPLINAVQQPTSVHEYGSRLSFQPFIF